MTTATPYLLTASGQRYRLVGPSLDTPRIGDIAHHLAQINRFTGAASRPYSVAEHSLLCEQIAASEGAGPMARLCALMHDGHEFATTDMSSPAKQAQVWWAGKQQQGYGTSNYDYFEQMHADHLRHSFGLLEAFTQHAADVKRWDLIALATERRDLMPQDDGEGWAILDGVEPWAHSQPGDLMNFDELEWKYWRDRFLDKFSFLTCAVNSSKSL